MKVGKADRRSTITGGKGSEPDIIDHVPQHSIATYFLPRGQYLTWTLPFPRLALFVVRFVYGSWSRKVRYFNQVLNVPFRAK